MGMGAERERTASTGFGCSTPELSPSPKEKCQGRLLDRNLGWESWVWCGFNNLWEKFPGNFQIDDLLPRASVDSISDKSGGQTAGRKERTLVRVGVLDSAPSATSSGRAGTLTLLGATASELQGLDPA